MSHDVVYTADVVWTGERGGRVSLGNGLSLPFSAPPEGDAATGVLTPEDAYVAAVAMCIMLMFVWSAERLRLTLLGYSCRSEGTKHIELDRTESFTRVVLRPRVRLAAGDEAPEAVMARARRAFASARKYSLVASSILSDLLIEPEITVEP